MRTIQISENGNQNLEEYLKNKLQNKDKNVTLVESKKAQNEKDRTQSEGISNVEHLGSESTGRNIGKFGENSQSEAKRKSHKRTKIGQQRCWKWTCRHNLEAFGRRQRKEKEDSMTIHNRMMMKK